MAAAACTAVDLNGDKRIDVDLHRFGYTEPALVRKRSGTVN